MIDPPPCPGLPALLLAAAAKLGWHQTTTHAGRALGQLRDALGHAHALVMVAGPTLGAVDWHLVPGHAPAGFAEYLFAADVAAALTQGTRAHVAATWSMDGHVGLHVAELLLEKKGIAAS